jgi:hypothetical protein
MVSFFISPDESKDDVLPPLKRSNMCLTEDSQYVKLSA